MISTSFNTLLHELISQSYRKKIQSHINTVRCQTGRLLDAVFQILLVIHVLIAIQHTTWCEILMNCSITATMLTESHVDSKLAPVATCLIVISFSTVSLLAASHSQYEGWWVCLSLPRKSYSPSLRSLYKARGVFTLF